jgi:hypothetical protein
MSLFLLPWRSHREGLNPYATQTHKERETHKGEENRNGEIDTRMYANLHEHKGVKVLDAVQGCLDDVGMATNFRLVLS